MLLAKECPLKGTVALIFGLWFFKNPELTPYRLLNLTLIYFNSVSISPKYLKSKVVPQNLILRKKETKFQLGDHLGHEKSVVFTYKQFRKIVPLND